MSLLCPYAMVNIVRTSFSSFHLLFISVVRYVKNLSRSVWGRLNFRTLIKRHQVPRRGTQVPKRTTRESQEERKKVGEEEIYIFTIVYKRRLIKKVEQRTNICKRSGVLKKSKIWDNENQVQPW